MYSLYDFQMNAINADICSYGENQLHALFCYQYHYQPHRLEPMMKDTREKVILIFHWFHRNYTSPMMYTNEAWIKLRIFGAVDVLS